MQCMSSKTGFILQVKRSGAAMAFIAMPHPCGGKMVTQPLLALLCNARPCSARVVWLLPHSLEPQNGPKKAQLGALHHGMMPGLLLAARNRRPGIYL